MPGFTRVEKELLDKSIKKNNHLYTSLSIIREAMEDIWGSDTPIIVKGFTDHGEKHCIRLVEKVKEILHVKTFKRLTENEMYLLFAGIYLHDIGMKCDVLTYPEILKVATNLGANFDDIQFTAEKADYFSLEEQKAIRRNHHYLAAAWIKYARQTKQSELAAAINTVPSKLVDDLIDICKFHSQLSLNYCPETLSFYPNERKKLVAAILRFSDELDIGEDNVSFETIKYFSMDVENSVYWWLHHFTTISFTGNLNNLVLITIGLNTCDFKLYSSIIYDNFIRNFESKNRQIMNVLSKGGIPLSIDSSSSVIENSAEDKLPDEVIKEIKKTWLRNFIPKDEIEKTYEGSIYGDRSTHFRCEKIILAKKVVDRIGTSLSNPDFSDLKFCLLIDSGTTTYHVFRQICQELKDPNKKKMWGERVYIVTNNLPGLQYLMINCKEEPSSERSEIALKCFFLPGKPLQPYVAVACDETVRWLSNLQDYLYKEWKLYRSDYQIISIMSASYVVLHEENENKNYYPVAREKGHVDVKNEFIKISDKVFLISPLLKFSFAGLEMLNGVHGYTIDREDFDKKLHDRSKLKYTEIPVAKNKCVFFTTSRKEGSRFRSFSYDLNEDLKGLYEEEKYKNENVVTEEFDIIHHIKGSKTEISIEIPHENLRKKYLKGINIWEKKWVGEHENEYSKP